MSIEMSGIVKIEMRGHDKKLACCCIFGGYLRAKYVITAISSQSGAWVLKALVSISAAGLFLLRAHDVYDCGLR